MTETLLLAFLLGVADMSQAHAASVDWDGGAGTTNWTDALNWNPNVVPSYNTSDQNYILTSGRITVDSGTATGGFVYVGASGPLTIEISGTGFLKNYGLTALSANRLTFLVTGPQASWTSTAGVADGVYLSNADLTISDGATASLNWNLEVGYYYGIPYPSSSVTVTGAGSSLTSANIFLGYYGSGTMTIADSGSVVDTNTFSIASQSGSTGVLAIGAAAGEAAAAPGTLSAAHGITFGAGHGTILFNHTDDAYVFAAKVTGRGLIEADAGSTTLTGDLSGFTGTYDVAGGALTFSNALKVGNTGTGSLLITSGTVTTGAGTSIGDAVGATGTAGVSGASSVWTNTGSFIVGNGGTASLAVASGGEVITDGAIVIAGQAGSTGVLAIGGASGEAAAAPGTLSATAIDFGLGTGTLLFNHTSDSYIFSLDISGSGTIEAVSGITRLTGDNSGFTGTTIVSPNALLSVNGSLGGALTVGNTGRLQGSGTVGSTVVQSGATVAPGNSIGTLHVNGDISFAPGSTYEVEIADDGTSDKIEATGTATITGGDVVVTPYAGSYTVGTTYNILSAGGGVTGTFDSVSLSVASLFLTTLLYDANDVYVKLVRNGAAFTDYAQTPNQSGTARVIDELGAGNALYDAVAALGLADDARGAFQATDGELHANMKMSILENRFAETNALLSRLAQAQAFLGDGVAPRVTADEEALAFWMQGYGQWNKRDGNANAAPFKDQDQGAVIGADGRLGDHGRVGLAFGFGHTEAQQAASATGHGRADHYSLSAYGGQTFGAWAVRVGGSYGRQTIDTDRSVAFPSYSDRLRASYNAQSGSVFAETSYGFDLSDGGRIEPFAGLSAAAVMVDGFQETGGAAALKAQEASALLGTTTLGLRGSQALPYLDGENGKARVHASAAWRHAMGDTAPDNTFAFDASAAFQSEGAALPREAALIETGIDYDLGDGATLGFAYKGQIAPQAASHQLDGRLAYRF